MPTNTGIVAIGAATSSRQRIPGGTNLEEIPLRDSHSDFVGEGVAVTHALLRYWSVGLERKGCQQN